MHEYKPADELIAEINILFEYLLTPGFRVLLMEPLAFLWTIHENQGPGPEIRHRLD